MTEAEKVFRIKCLRDIPSPDETGILSCKKGDILYGTKVEPQYIVGALDPENVYIYEEKEIRFLITVGDGWFELAEEE